MNPLLRWCLLLGAVVGVILALDSIYNGGHLLASFLGRPATLHRP